MIWLKARMVHLSSTALTLMVD